MAIHRSAPIPAGARYGFGGPNDKHSGKGPGMGMPDGQEMAGPTGWTPEARTFMHDRRTTSVNKAFTGDGQAKELAAQILGYALYNGSIEKAMREKRSESVLDRTLRLTREGGR